MENYYLCPHCRGHLRVGDHIVFKVRNTLREKGLLLLHPELENFTSIIHPKFHFEEGERIDFFCPLCMSSLDAALDETLVHVIKVNALGEEEGVYFSRITGTTSTYKASSRGALVTGVHSYRYTHFRKSDKRSFPMHN